MSQYFLAGNLWSIFAVLAFIGRKSERWQPTMYSFFGVGGWFTPGQYALLQAGLMAAALGCFVLHWWRSRSSANGTGVGLEAGA